MGSKRGGTEGIARIIGETLQREGIEVQLLLAAQAQQASGFEAVSVGGALYANRWHGAARRFVARRAEALRRVPVWFFSSGPLDDSAAQSEVEPVPRVQLLMQRVGAQGHATFGGRLTRDARGFPASSMAQRSAGDWRDPERIRVWAKGIASALPAAVPRPWHEPEGRSLTRLLLHALFGWALCALTMGAALAVTSVTAAVVLQLVAAPLLFTVVAIHYHRVPGAREPLPTAVTSVDMLPPAKLAEQGR